MPAGFCEVLWKKALPAGIASNGLAVLWGKRLWSIGRAWAIATISLSMSDISGFTEDSSWSG